MTSESCVGHPIGDFPLFPPSMPTLVGQYISEEDIRRVVREELAKISPQPAPVAVEDFETQRREALKKELFDVQNSLTGINDDLKRLNADRVVAINRVMHLQAQLTVLNAQIEARSGMGEAP